MATHRVSILLISLYIILIGCFTNFIIFERFHFCLELTAYNHTIETKNIITLLKQKIIKNDIIDRSIYITVLFTKLDNWFEYVKKESILEDVDSTQPSN